MKDNFSELIKAASLGVTPSVSADFERRVMLEVARRAIERSRRRARRGLVASLSGLAMLLAGCIAALVVWHPVLFPVLSPPSWLVKLRILEFGFLDAVFATGQTGDPATLSFFGQWGGLILLILLIIGVAGFIYYLNSHFSSDHTLD